MRPPWRLTKADDKSTSPTTSTSSLTNYILEFPSEEPNVEDIGRTMVGRSTAIRAK
eukprot:UN05808